MYVQSTIVCNEAKLSESVHEEIHSWAGCTNHLGQSLLAYVRDDGLQLAFFSEVGQYQKRPRQPLFAGIEHLID
jgi:hypothetical protein